MKKKITIPLIAFTALIAFLMWWFSTGEVLKRRSNTLLDCVYFEPNTGRVERAHNAETLKDIIASHITLSYPEIESNFAGADIISEPITISEDQAKTALLYLSVSAEHITISDRTVKTVSVEGDKAQLETTFTMVSKLKHGANSKLKLRGVLDFQKTKGKWKLHAATFSTRD